MGVPCKQPSDRLFCDEDLVRKLALAELEVLHLNEFLKQVTQKYTEDIRKLEEKVQYIIIRVLSLSQRKGKKCLIEQLLYLLLQTTTGTKTQDIASICWFKLFLCLTEGSSSGCQNKSQEHRRAGFKLESHLYFWLICIVPLCYI